MKGWREWQHRGWRTEVTPPRTLGVFKPMQDTKADFLMDRKEGRYSCFDDAIAALRGSYGFTVNHCYVIIGGWLMEEKEATRG